MSRAKGLAITTTITSEQKSRPELRQPESGAGRAAVGVQAFAAVTNAIAPLIAHRVALVCEVL
jgi:hypothetical protein